MKSAFVLAAVLLSSSVAIASPVTYNVSEHVGSSSAVGTVTTDGTLGVLTSANIVNFTFTVSNATNSSTFSKGYTNSAGNDLTATATGLFFDFSGAAGGIIFADTSSGQNALCFTVPNVNCNFVTGLSIAVAGTPESNTSLTGLQQIGTAGTSVTPEPSSLLLLGTGALGAIGMVRRRLSAI